MLTDAAIEGFAALAGPTFSWDGVPGCSRPASDVRTELRNDILAAQGYVCAQCGDALTEAAAEFCHIVARGPKVKGFIPGNVFAGHPACNASTKPEWDADGNLVRGIPVLRVADLKRADVVPTEWTPFPILRERKRNR